MAKHTDLQKAIRTLTKRYLSSENRRELQARIRSRLTPTEITNAFPLYKEYGYTAEEIATELIEYIVDYLITGNIDSLLSNKSSKDNQYKHNSVRELELD